MKSLKTSIISAFPVLKHHKPTNCVSKVEICLIFCHCRLPDNGDKMVCCDSCNEWFHVWCVDSPQWILMIIGFVVGVKCTDLYSFCPTTLLVLQVCLSALWTSHCLSIYMITTMKACVARDTHFELFCYTLALFNFFLLQMFDHAVVAFSSGGAWLKLSSRMR